MNSLELLKLDIKNKQMRYFNELLKSNNRLAHDIKDFFISEVPKELTVLHRAIEQKDHDTIKEMTVKLKSSVSVVGLDNVKPLLNLIEEKSATGAEITHIAAMFSDVKSCCDMAIQELENA